MQSFIGISHLLLILQLQLVLAQITPTTEEAGPRVMTILDMWAKSMCHPLEKLVDVEQEFPEEVGYKFSPPCVPLKRCSGCCQDERQECQPTLERNVTVELLRVTSSQPVKVTLTFVEHQKCECRPRQNLLKERSVESIKTKPQRKTKKTPNGCGKCQFPRDKISLH